MTNHDIPVKSITYAMKGQKILQKYGITASVGRDHSIKSGCGYQLSIRGNYDLAMELLRKNGISLPTERP